VFLKVPRPNAGTGHTLSHNIGAERVRITVVLGDGYEHTVECDQMKHIAPIFWIMLAIAALIYWSNSDDHRSQASSAKAEAYSDNGGADGSGTFHGEPCTVDCSGHQAGYDWAEEHDIVDEDNCGGNSESFIEGCKAYVREQQGTADDDSADDDSEREDD
jgi:hypothetical protein